MPGRRKLPTLAGRGHHNQARRSADGDLDNALELLEYAQAQAFTVASFRRFLKGVVFEGKVRRRDFPLWLQAILPSFVGEFWVEIKRVKPEEE